MIHSIIPVLFTCLTIFFAQRLSAVLEFQNLEFQKENKNNGGDGRVWVVG